jgi:hypothetical protein
MPELSGGSEGERGKSSNVSDYLALAFLSLACVFFLQIIQSRIDLNLADEGMLWYGVQRTLLGEIPIRDFQGYDPARYYLLAAWAWIWRDDGIVTLRLGIAAIQWAALFSATLLIRRIAPRKWMVPIFLVLLALWMAPRHKMLDVTATIWMTQILAALAERPTLPRYFLAGVAAGLFWLIGINHALYAAISSALLMVLLAFQDRIRWRQLATQSGFAIGGMLVGVTPLVLMLVMVPGFGRRYWEIKIVQIFELGTTNVGLPIPWPWRSDVPWNSWEGLSARATGLGFVVLPLTVLVTVALVIIRKRRGVQWREPVLLAAAAATGGWSFHAFSRADLPHLAQAGSPLVVALLALPEVFSGLPRVLVRFMAWSTLGIITFFAMPTLNPMVIAHRSPEANYQWHMLNGERLYVPQFTFDICQVTGQIVGRLNSGRSLLAAPYVPGLYAEFRLRDPIWESYSIFPATTAEQNKAIADMIGHRTDWVLYWPDHIDERPDLGFANTDPLIWKFVQNNYQPVEGVGVGDMSVFERKISNN